jgi:hypothetical protein
MVSNSYSSDEPKWKSWTLDESNNDIIGISLCSLSNVDPWAHSHFSSIDSWKHPAIKQSILTMTHHSSATLKAMEAQNYLVFVVTCCTDFANHRPHPQVTCTICRFTCTYGTLGTGRSSECPWIGYGCQLGSPMSHPKWMQWTFDSGDTQRHITVQDLCSVLWKYPGTYNTNTSHL